MDTAEVAQALGTNPRTLRAFLRSPMSTFVAVGSGSRYEFDDKDIPTLRKRFTEWQGAGRPKSVPSESKPAVVVKKPHMKKADLDAQVWADEESSHGGVPKLEDIRDPRVRARVKREAEAQEERLNMLLIAHGLHITQGGIDASARVRRAS